MATPRPSLIEDVARLRPLTDAAAARLARLPRRGRDGGRRSAAGADLVGMARALIADPDLPRKVLAGRDDEVRPCVACNEDCRSFDPALLCTVNPDLAAPGDTRRRAAPLIRRRAASVAAARRDRRRRAGRPGGGADAAARRRAEVVVFESAQAIGGTIAWSRARPTAAAGSASSTSTRATSTPRASTCASARAPRPATSPTSTPSRRDRLRGDAARDARRRAYVSRRARRRRRRDRRALAPRRRRRRLLVVAARQRGRARRSPPA